MRYTRLIAQGVDVLPVHLALLRNPTLWNRQRERNIGPHQGVDDVWVRYNDFAHFNPKDAARFNDEHDSIWYPAYHDLRCLDALIFPLMQNVKGERLGGVLITRISPHCEVKPHVDRGWHAEYYDKYAIQIAANSQQFWGNEDGRLVTKPGDVYWFNNQASHWVKNDSDEDRITCIVCIKHSKS